MINRVSKNIFLKDNNNVLGFIRLSCSILGGLVLAYLTIIYISKFLEYTVFENIVIAIILLPLFWSIFSLWIVLSKTKFIAILKTVIPVAVLYILVFMVK